MIRSMQVVLLAFTVWFVVCLPMNADETAADTVVESIELNGPAQVRWETHVRIHTMVIIRSDAHEGAHFEWELKRRGVVEPMKSGIGRKLTKLCTGELKLDLSVELSVAPHPTGLGDGDFDLQVVLRGRQRTG